MLVFLQIQEKSQTLISAGLLTRKYPFSKRIVHRMPLANRAGISVAPKQPLPAQRDIMSFAGIGKGLWGDSPEAIEESIQALRASWTR